MFALRIDSPYGSLILRGTASTLTGVGWPGALANQADFARGSSPALDRAAAQLREYFAGERRSFDLALDPRGTDVQRRVWRVLLDIPFGRTVTYGDLARALGRPTWARVVGAANARNPLAIVVPCHRVIGRTGDLTGFAGGLNMKTGLLDFEARQLNALRRRGSP